jgi:ATP-dependent Clp protease adaptor protein ClpS
VELLRAGAEKVAPPQLLPDPDEAADRSRPWRVVVHNDDYTPAEYVTRILNEVFRLSWPRAAFVMVRAHMAGRADVAILPRDEASQRIAAAHARARGDGWPLHFTKEPVD